MKKILLIALLALSGCGEDDLEVGDYVATTDGTDLCGAFVTFAQGNIVVFWDGATNQTAHWNNIVKVDACEEPATAR